MARKTTATTTSTPEVWAKDADVRVGIDLSDKKSRWSAVDTKTGEFRRGIVEMTPAAVRACFAGTPPATFTMEAGTHSHWLWRELQALGHRAFVLPADVLCQRGGVRRRRNDSKDADDLRDLACDVDRPRMRKIWQRPDEYQYDLALMRLRDGAVSARADLVRRVRTIVKPFGERVRSCDVEYLPRHAREDLSAKQLALVEPMLVLLEQANKTVAAYDALVAAYLERRPESARLRSIKGVGPVTAGVVMAVVGDPARFPRPSDVSAYLGLVPGQDQSGEYDPQLRITKAGDPLARKTLMECAQYMMSDKGMDCALKRWALALAGDGKNRIRKKKATVALARKLAVLLLVLWQRGETYNPWHGRKQPDEASAA